MTKKIELIKGDITLLKVDAIVNAANKSLLGGGGVDGAIHRAAGHELLDYCIPLNGCATGEAKITPGFKLQAKYIIHAVGPVWKGGEKNEASLLRSCYTNSLRLAEENGCKSMAFPCISTGVYGYPKQEAARIAVDAINEYLQDADLKVVVCVFDDENLRIYEELLNE